jgi:hypothetical protein
MREGLAPRSSLLLIVFAIAFGAEEAIIVLYLRLISPDAGMVNVATLANGVLQHVGHLETARELCTLIILATIAWLADARLDMRLRSFAVAFGAWDISYYLFLWLLSSYPQLSSADVLFLIPIPWVGPVWAAVSFAVMLVLVGIYGVERSRVWALVAGLVLGWLSFLYGPLLALIVDHVAATPSALSSLKYPIWLFLPALVLIAASLQFGDVRASVTRLFGDQHERGRPL